jgi:hypothetical protein
MDNPRKKELDAKRISRQKHEKAYLRKIAKEQLGRLHDPSKTVSVAKVERCLKAILKFVK